MIVFGSGCFQFSAKIILELILHDLHYFNFCNTHIKAHLLMSF
ncbi:hypothetical protein HNP34_000519 [Acinetobacter lwoffii]|uniref:Uncharacterized protein n=1 Tax=Acinetobacter lwoffii TaxID=28090 RepID=A0AAW3VBK1_ACILW|nr:hypothetical protein [Acinetobacter lwoffii]